MHSKRKIPLSVQSAIAQIKAEMVEEKMAAALAESNYGLVQTIKATKVSRFSTQEDDDNNEAGRSLFLSRENQDQTEKEEEEDEDEDKEDEDEDEEENILDLMRRQRMELHMHSAPTMSELDDHDDNADIKNKDIESLYEINPAFEILLQRARDRIPRVDRFTELESPRLMPKPPVTKISVPASFRRPLSSPSERTQTFTPLFTSEILATVKKVFTPSRPISSSRAAKNQRRFGIDNAPNFAQKKATLTSQLLSSEDIKAQSFSLSIPVPPKQMMPQKQQKSGSILVIHQSGTAMHRLFHPTISHDILRRRNLIHSYTLHERILNSIRYSISILKNDKNVLGIHLRTIMDKKNISAEQKVEEIKILIEKDGNGKKLHQKYKKTYANPTEFSIARSMSEICDEIILLSKEKMTESTTKHFEKNLIAINNSYLLYEYEKQCDDEVSVSKKLRSGGR